MHEKNKPFIFDAHLDLAMNAMEWNRDLRCSVSNIRNSENGMNDKPDRGNNTVSFEAMREGKVGICVATLIARFVKKHNPLPGWRSQEQAWAQTQGQFSWYGIMEELGHLRKISNKKQLWDHFSNWEQGQSDNPIGYVLSLEGADSIVNLDYLHRAYIEGLRALGPAHYGPGIYAHGTSSSGGIGEKGRNMLEEMEKLGFILDVTHLCDQSFWEALDHFNGPIWSSHTNCRALVPHQRQFSDEQIEELIRRNAVLGIALDAWMLSPDWIRGKSTPSGENVTLNNIIEHIDHICQMAGDSDHVGIGSDLDGGFGKEQTPDDLDTIADLQQLGPLLKEKGYQEEDVTKILSGNWIRFLMDAWD